MGYGLGNPVNWVDPSGLAMSDILPGIKKAIVDGSKAGAFATGEAVKAIYDIALNGPPGAQVLIGVAGATTVLPLAGVVAPELIPATYLLAPYSKQIVDVTYGFFTATGTPQGWGYASSGTIYFYENIIKKYLVDNNANVCEE